MGVNYGGYILIDGRQVDVGSAEFNEALPITAGIIADVQADDDIASVTTALSMAITKLEIEVNNLRDRCAELEATNANLNQVIDERATKIAYEWSKA